MDKGNLFLYKRKKEDNLFSLQKKERRHSTAEAEAVLQENNLVHRKTAILFLQKKERRQSLLEDVRQSLYCIRRRRQSKKKTI